MDYMNGRLLPYKDKFPKLHRTVFVTEGCYIIGDVEIGAGSSVWFGSVIRGDVHHIRIGERTNVQDGTIIHVTHDAYPTLIGNDVTLGHGVMLHGCTIHDTALIGMRATILDQAVIGKNSLIAAGTLIRERFVVPEGVLVAGLPGKIIRDLTDEEIKNLHQSSLNYQNYVKTYLDMKEER
ncbi:MAG: gamma carbonic anhydrase family protein [Bacteroidetes bacterium]|nr:gamma carbonic anhydrase family protein [Bacteroidota bacterium]